MSSNFRGFAYHAVKIFCAVVMIVSAVFIFYSVGPKLETAYWPVVSKLRLQTLESTPAGWTKIRVSFTKLRDCEYLRIAWYRGDRVADFEQVPVMLQRDPSDNGSPNRPMGTQRAGPWIIWMTEEEFRKGSFAQLTHRCHPFWNSITDFYP